MDQESIQMAARRLADRIIHWQKLRPSKTYEQFQENLLAAILDCAREDLQVIGQYDPALMQEFIKRHPPSVQPALTDLGNGTPSVN